MILCGLAFATGAFVPVSEGQSKVDFAISLTPIASFRTGGSSLEFDLSAAENVVFDKKTKRIFIGNAQQNSIVAIDVRNPSRPRELFAVDLSSFGREVNGLALRKGGLLAVAVENIVKQQQGVVVFLDLNGNILNFVRVGAQPDMIVFSPNGKMLLVANEGEPRGDYTYDPPGTISVIDTRGSRGRIARQEQMSVTELDFERFDDLELDPSVRVNGPGSSPSRDFEPEFIAVSRDSQRAWVTLQENNAIALIDLKNMRIDDVRGLGWKDHSLPGQGLDPSDRDDGVQIATWPVYGIFQPDAVQVYRAAGREYLVTANEGDSRDLDGFTEETRIRDAVLDPVQFPNAASLQESENLGRLQVSTSGDTDGDGDLDRLESFGARSFSIWDEDAQLVWDSGDQLEQLTAAALPDQFNSEGDENNSFDSRSDDRGPEPEALAIGKFRGRMLAFVGLERVGGIAVFDITLPTAPRFLTYFNPRDFSGNPANDTAGDLGPENFAFAKRGWRGAGQALLFVANEISGSVTILAINETS